MQNIKSIQIKQSRAIYNSRALLYTASPVNLKPDSFSSIPPVEHTSHLAIGMTAAHLAPENVATLSRRSLGPLVVPGHPSSLAVRASAWALSLDYLMPIPVGLHDKLASIASISCAYAAGTLVVRRAATHLHLVIRHYLALRSYRWNFVVVFLRKRTKTGSTQH